MIDDQLSPEEEAIVRQIQAASKPTLDAAVRDEIRQRIVTEFRTLNLSAQAHHQSIRPRFSALRLAALAAAAMVVAAIGLLIALNGDQSLTPITATSPITPSPANQVVVVPSLTIESTHLVTDSTVIVSAVPVLTTESGLSIATTTPFATQSIAASTPTVTQEIIVNIEGPVTSIAGNMMTIYGFNVQVAPQHPILQVIDIGDVVHVEGVVGSDGAVIARVVSNIPDAFPVNGSSPTVGLDGPVEAIKGNIITVNAIPVQLVPDDPLLQTIQVGNFVSVQGDFQASDSTVVLVVVNISIINNTTVQSDCSYHVDGMGMGHWHCDGMGMGMGMGDDGMGMGDDGMGMGMGG